MAAGQQKKRLHASSVVSCDLQERSGTKKKKNVVSPHNFLNMKAHISLEWDERQQKVVAKREQIGIAWRKLGPFVNPLPPRHNALADVLSIPQETFVLEDMTGVLSYEVWETHLSEAEKSYLTQFLPKGADTEKVVHELLMGGNLHFGNPFLKWGVSLCSGKLHPDAILCQEERVSAYKKAYDLELEKYQSEYLTDDTVECLQKLKETWTSCEGPEKDIVENMWREGHAGKRGNISKATERANVVASPRKEEKSQRLYVRSGDGAKYMSYFKITRRQHQLVQGIKQPDGIKSKSLNHLLGDIRSFQVQPYEVYEEEERTKLHEHWLGLVHRDLPSAFTNWTERLSQIKHLRWSLVQEMEENKVSAHEDEDETLPLTPGSLLEEQSDIGDTEEEEEDDEEEAMMEIHTIEEEEESSPSSYSSEKLLNSEPEESSEEIFEPDSVLSKPPYEIEPMNTDSDEGSRDRNPNYSADVTPHHELDTLDIDLGVNLNTLDVSKPENSIPLLSQFPSTENPPNHGYLSSGLPDSYYPPPVNHGYLSSTDIALQPHFIQKPSIDLRPGLNSGFHSDVGGSYSSSYGNQDWEREYYMQQAMRNRYPCPSQEMDVFAPVNVNIRNWVPESHQESSLLRPEMLNDNATPSSVGSSTDGSLYSVLSQFNTSQPSYNAVNISEGGGRDFLPYGGNQQANNMTWVNMAGQNPGRLDSMGKPYLRSWNL